MQSLSQEEINVLRLSLVNGIGPRTFIEIIQRFESISNFLSSANLDEFGKIIEKFNKIEIDEYLSKLEKFDVKIIELFDPNYPKLLSNIYDPPIVLYYKGSFEIQNLNSQSLFSIVGSRNLNDYGKKVTKSFASELSQTFVIVSGMAFGADYIAHDECLKAGKSTVAVLASSVEKPTPLSNKDLYERILENGLVISEYPTGTEPVPGNFPQRNRIVSGLSLGTLVTQARLDSGSLITPKLALEQGREAFAIPGPIYDDNHAGTNMLIQTGQAQLVSKANDILQSLNLTTDKIEKLNNFQPQNEIQKTILNEIKLNSLSVDELIAKLQFSVSEININLSILEMEGVIVRNEVGKLS